MSRREFIRILLDADDGGEATGTGEGEGSESKEEDSGTEQNDVPTKPDWVDEKHWDQKSGEVRTEALARSYKDAQSRLSQLLSGKDDNGSLEDYMAALTFDEEGFLQLPEGVDRLEPVGREDHALGALMQAMHNNGVPSDKAPAILQEVLVGINGFMPEVSSEEQELAKLGDNGKAMQDAVHATLDRLHSAGVLTDEGLNELKITAMNADGIQALMALRGELGEKPLPTDPTLTTDGIPSLTECYQMVGTEEWRTNEAFREKVEGYIKHHTGDAPGNSPPPGIGVPALRESS